ncbi:hypothetical protein ACHAXT_006001 [Thalassiosira profunda]
MSKRGALKTSAEENRAVGDPPSWASLLQDAGGTKRGGYEGRPRTAEAKSSTRPNHRNDGRAAVPSNPNKRHGVGANSAKSAARPPKKATQASGPGSLLAAQGKLLGKSNKAMAGSKDPTAGSSGPTNTDPRRLKIQEMIGQRRQLLHAVKECRAAAEDRVSSGEVAQIEYPPEGKRIRTQWTAQQVMDACGSEDEENEMEGFEWLNDAAKLKDEAEHAGEHHSECVLVKPENVRSPFWVHFKKYDREAHPEKKTTANCSLCGKDISIKMGTAGLKSHLAKKHPEEYAALVKSGDEAGLQVKGGAPSSGKSSSAAESKGGKPVENDEKKKGAEARKETREERVVRELRENKVPEPLLEFGIATDKIFEKIEVHLDETTRKALKDRKLGPGEYHSLRNRIGQSFWISEHPLIVELAAQRLRNSKAVRNCTVETLKCWEEKQCKALFGTKPLHGGLTNESVAQKLDRKRLEEKLAKSEVAAVVQDLVNAALAERVDELESEKELAPRKADAATSLGNVGEATQERAAYNPPSASDEAMKAAMGAEIEQLKAKLAENETRANEQLKASKEQLKAMGTENKMLKAALVEMKGQEITCDI